VRTERAHEVGRRRGDEHGEAEVEAPDEGVVSGSGGGKVRSGEVVGEVDAVGGENAPGEGVDDADGEDDDPAVAAIGDVMIVVEQFLGGRRCVELCGKRLRR
jgi:hypothetical protein